MSAILPKAATFVKYINASDPQTDDLLKVMARYEDGIDARTLAKELAGLGYAEYKVQRAIQRALDRGVLEIGPKLRLFSAHADLLDAGRSGTCPHDFP